MTTLDKPSSAPPAELTGPDRRSLICSGRLHPSMTFSERVWTLTARIPEGRVTTYAQIARKLDTRAYRAVGHAMGRNPYAPEVPCHRVVGSDGDLRGFADGLEKKRSMLASEGVALVGGRVALEEYFFQL